MTQCDAVSSPARDEMGAGDGGKEDGRMGELQELKRSFQMMW